MDPNETLRLLDEARDDLRIALAHGHRGDTVDACDRIQLHAGNLHHWLNRGGFLPTSNPIPRSESTER